MNYMFILVCKNYTIQINDYSLNKRQYKILLTKTYSTLKKNKIKKRKPFSFNGLPNVLFLLLTNLSLLKVLLTGQQGYF